MGDSAGTLEWISGMDACTTELILPGVDACMAELILVVLVSNYSCMHCS